MCVYTYPNLKCYTYDDMMILDNLEYFIGFPIG